MLTEFGKALEREIVKALDDAAVSLASGSVASMEDYRKRCGRITGLKEALDLAKEIDRKLMGEDEEQP